MRVFFLILLALVVGAGLGHFGPTVFAASDLTELTFPTPDPDPKFVKAPRPGQSYACDPVAAANVFDDKLKKRAAVWTNYSASKLAIQVSGDGKKLVLARAIDVTAGVAQPEEFAVTSNNSSYLTAKEDLTLGVATIILDVRTSRMVWSFNGQGMLGMKGETVLLQCH